MKAMKTQNLSLIMLAVLFSFCKSHTNKVQESNADTGTKTRLYLDVHNLEPGKVKFSDVEAAHQKDLATQGKYGVNFIKYWVDEIGGKVYCLVESPDSASVSQTHKVAHGLIPDFVHFVSDGMEADGKGSQDLYLDIHELGPGNVTEEAVAEAHLKDLAVQGKYNVNFINYWVDEKAGKVVCLSNADNSNSVVSTHKEAHGLLPTEIHRVKQGQ